jgi:hypothetical protein
MTDDPWGADTPAAVPADLPPLPPELAELAQFVARGGSFTPPPSWHWPTERDLPEVRALVEEGWSPLGAMGDTGLLPAVWPPEHRAWVPDRLPHLRLAMTVEKAWMEPQPPEQRAEHEAHLAEEAAEVGLPAPPPGRIWILRSQWPSLTVEMVIAVLRRWRDEHEPRRDSSDGLLAAARDVLGWSEEQVWGWWNGPQADAARAWRAVGRPAAEVSDLVLAALDPEQTARLTSPIESGGAGLTEAQAASWLDRLFRPSVGEAVEVIIGWRALGLPAKPRGWMTLNEMEPSEAAKWLAEGFTFDDVSALHGIATLEAARRWREHGYAAERARDLLLADGSLTSDEASAFDAAGLEPDAVIGWVATGFSAEEARGWTDVDVLPMEARVWRSVGLRPDDARRQKAAGGGELPDGVNVGWTAFGEGREHRCYGANDPPGTRGSVAEESRDMRDLLRDD